MISPKAPLKSKAAAAFSKHGMVSTASRKATEAGVKMLELGGNAVDAAAAAAFCLSVTEPQASGLGGQSMVLLYLADSDSAVCLDGSSRAPFSVHAHKLPSEPLKVGITSTTVPSTPAVLGYLLDKYGKLSLEQVLEPAVEAARKGFKLTSLQHTLLERESSKLRKDPQVLKNFFRNGHGLRAGQLLKQPELADCLERMGKAGWHDFYQGEIAQKIIKDMEQRGGIISSLDLCRIPLPVERPPLEASYRSKKLLTFPPPGAGRALVQILNILENFTPQELAPGTASACLILALAFRATLKTRQRLPVDPALFMQMPNKLMLDKGYAQEIAGHMQNFIDKTMTSYFTPPETSGETTHLSVADAAGNVVGITQSIELVFGSKTSAQGLGFFYNNYMSAFNYKDIKHPYYLLPGAKPFSSVAPTMIFKENKPRLILGSPGSERISTSLAQVISRIFDAGQDLAEAIDGPRLHASAGGKVQIEFKRFSGEALEALQQAGFEITKRGAYSFYLGCVQAVKLPLSPEESFTGVSDPRRDGTAQGPKN